MAHFSTVWQGSPDIAHSQVEGTKKTMNQSIVLNVVFRSLNFLVQKLKKLKVSMKDESKGFLLC